MQKINWRHAFDGSGMSMTQENRQRVLNALSDWNSDWHVEHSSLWVTRIEDEDGDYIWDCEDGTDQLENHFSDGFVDWMDRQFNGGKKKVVIGTATKLPLPVASPPSSSKGAVSSSSF